MSTTTRLLVATSNPGKMRELAALFADEIGRAHV